MLPSVFETWRAGHEMRMRLSQTRNHQRDNRIAFTCVQYANNSFRPRVSACFTLEKLSE